MTNESARQWLSSHTWANGINVMPHSSINLDEMARQLEANTSLWEQLFQWLETTNLNALSPGQVVIVDNQLWVNVMAYEPKSIDDTPVESHRDMIDLQYTWEGNELMGLATDVETTEAYKPDKDVEKYRATGPVSYSPATPDNFFIYFPFELHQPSVAAPGEKIGSRKIVAKIRNVK